MSSSIKLHFQRFEFKYLLSPELETEIRDFLHQYMVHDDFAQAAGNRSYQVYSLYYDSPFFDFYQEKIDGLKNRKKIRLRTYKMNGVFSHNVFLEIKRKHDSVVKKDRCALTPELVEAIREGNPIGITEGVIGEFEVDRLSRGLRPVVLVVYEREPFVGRFNPNVRITFDRLMRSAPASDLYSDTAEQIITPGRTLFEVKFNGALPHYIARLIQNFNLERVTYSKYCNGIDTSVNPWESVAVSRRNFALGTYA